MNQDYLYKIVSSLEGVYDYVHDHQLKELVEGSYKKGYTYTTWKMRAEEAVLIANQAKEDYVMDEYDAERPDLEEVDHE